MNICKVIIFVILTVTTAQYKSYQPLQSLISSEIFSDIAIQHCANKGVILLHKAQTINTLPKISQKNKCNSHNKYCIFSIISTRTTNNIQIRAPSFFIT